LLCRVEAPYYVAGLIIENGVVVQAAPILFWAVGKSWNYVRDYFDTKRYKWEFVAG
jgi:hypothetical protein